MQLHLLSALVLVTLFSACATAPDDKDAGPGGGSGGSGGGGGGGGARADAGRAAGSDGGADPLGAFCLEASLQACTHLRGCGQLGAGQLPDCRAEL